MVPEMIGTAEPEIDDNRNIELKYRNIAKNCNKLSILLKKNAHIPPPPKVHRGL